MRHFIDRRLNPKNKSLGNRQRFLRRTRAEIKEAVNRSMKDRSISNPDDGKKVSIPAKGIREPRFRLSDTDGRRRRVLPGNKEFAAGDRLPKPRGGGDGRSKKGSDHGDGEDDFSFVLSREEFLDLFFEDLELPDLVKISLKDTTVFKPKRAGFTTAGPTTNLNVLRTMRNSYGRRLALKRPVLRDIETLREECTALEEEGELDGAKQQRLLELKILLEKMEQRWRTIPYIDPIDVRYNRFDLTPAPRTSAVMICLMDVSGSMGQEEKDLAKRFFVLLHLFLKRCYERIEIVFIRHTHEAKEVDEDAFFHSRETGGTIVSTALKEAKKIIEERYPSNIWNIYIAQASDGDNFENDMDVCLDSLASDLLPVCQYFAYIEILSERELKLIASPDDGKTLWRGYRRIQDDWPNFAMKQIARPGDIYPVFRELFAKRAHSG